MALTEKGEDWVGKHEYTEAYANIHQDEAECQAEFWLRALFAEVERRADDRYDWMKTQPEHWKTEFRNTTEYGYALVEVYNQLKRELLGGDNG